MGGTSALRKCSRRRLPRLPSRRRGHSLSRPSRRLLPLPLRLLFRRYSRHRCPPCRHHRRPRPRHPPHPLHHRRRSVPGRRPTSTKPSSRAATRIGAEPATPPASPKRTPGRGRCEVVRRLPTTCPAPWASSSACPWERSRWLSRATASSSSMRTRVVARCSSSLHRSKSRAMQLYPRAHRRHRRPPFSGMNLSGEATAYRFGPGIRASWSRRGARRYVTQTDAARPGPWTCLGASRSTGWSWHLMRATATCILTTSLASRPTRAVCAGGRFLACHRRPRGRRLPRRCRPCPHSPRYRHHRVHRHPPRQIFRHFPCRPRLPLPPLRRFVGRGRPTSLSLTLTDRGCPAGAPAPARLCPPAFGRGTAASGRARSWLGAWASRLMYHSAPTRLAMARAGLSTARWRPYAGSLPARECPATCWHRWYLPPHPNLLRHHRRPRARRGVPPRLLRLHCRCLPPARLQPGPHLRALPRQAHPRHRPPPHQTRDLLLRLRHLLRPTRLRRARRHRARRLRVPRPRGHRDPRHLPRPLRRARRLRRCPFSPVQMLCFPPPGERSSPHGRPRQAPDPPPMVWSLRRRPEPSTRSSMAASEARAGTT